MEIEISPGQRAAGMRPLTRRCSPSSRLAATTSKSFYEVCVKAPRRLQSPSAQMAGTLVARVSPTVSAA